MRRRHRPVSRIASPARTEPPGNRTRHGRPDACSRQSRIGVAGSPRFGLVSESSGGMRSHKGQQRLGALEQPSGPRAHHPERNALSWSQRRRRTNDVLSPVRSLARGRSTTCMVRSRLSVPSCMDANMRSLFNRSHGRHREGERSCPVRAPSSGRNRLGTR